MFFQKNELNRIIGRTYTKNWVCDNPMYPTGFPTFSLKFVIEHLTMILTIQDIRVAPLYVNDPEFKEMAKDVLQGSFRGRFEIDKINELIKVVNCTPEELTKLRSLELRDWLTVLPKKEKK